MSESIELRKNLAFEEKEESLRADVHRLGEMVGAMIREQGGESLFAAVETARRAAIQQRESETPEQDLKKVLAQIPSTMYGDMIRAFTAWFQVVKLAPVAVSTVVCFFEKVSIGVLFSRCMMPVMALPVARQC